MKAMLKSLDDFLKELGSMPMAYYIFAMMMSFIGLVLIVILIQYPFYSVLVVAYIIALIFATMLGKKT